VQVYRPLFAAHPSTFGRARGRVADEPAAAVSNVADDLKLFAATFLAGFLFVSILIG
jgi:hypothetical protein